MEKRMLYNESYDIIAKYANEMLPYFADHWQRFPQGGNAAMIVNYLNDRAMFYYKIDENIAKDLVNVATEIITREK